MKRLSVDETIYDNVALMDQWLYEQGLSRFYFEVSRENGIVEIDVHPLPAEPVTGTPAIAARREVCNDPECRLCGTGPHDSIADNDDAPELADEYRVPPLTEFGRYFVDQATSKSWKRPLRLVDDTDPIPAVLADRQPLPWLTVVVPVLVWVVSILAALVAAFVCVRLWYVRYGCPFWPDHGLLSACKALTIRVHKL